MELRQLNYFIAAYEEGSITRAAQRLNIHKQTLVYRIRRIEEITGRSLESTEDVTALWIALRSAQIAGIEQ